MRSSILLTLLLVTRLALAQGDINSPDATEPAPAPAKPAAKSATSTKSRNQTAAQMQSALDELTQSNHDLLDLLKKQQVVLEDMQYDRRLESRQIQSLEERLTSTMIENTALQKQVATLEAQLSAQPSTSSAAPIASNPASGTTPMPPTPTNAPPVAVAPAPPHPPDTYLPQPDQEGAPGTKSWHRLFTLKGQDTKQTDLFHVEGKTWRVLWHNQDPPKLANTSALFINAFPKDDTIPQKVCSKLGTGGDSTELEGPGNYYLKIEASGGNWELAVEDFR